MDIYALDPDLFLRTTLIEDFTSAIWTERYFTPGDVNLVLPDTPAARELVHTDTLLALEGSKEVMLVDTVNTKDGLLTATGSTLLGFLNERTWRDTSNAATTQRRIPGNSIGEIIAHVVTNLTPSGLGTGFDDFYEMITNLTMGAVDTSVTVGTAIFPYGVAALHLTRRETSEAVNYGPMLDVITALAQTANLGMSLYLDSASDVGYSLKFTVYAGLDRTSTQSVNELVRFTPNLDSLANIKELYSSKGHKNVAVGFLTLEADPPRGDLTNAYAPQIAYEAGFNPNTSGFSRRSLQVLVSDITQEDLAVITDPQLRAAILQRATDALANNNYTKVVDGEVVPQSGYEFGEHYGMGDIVELESATGVRSPARVTEYIRSQDENGETAYPTISVI